jgi:tetratricopeptide (TPR) repeat protein
LNEGTAVARPLREALAAFRAALEVHTRAEHPVNWAALQYVLGNALRNQASRAEGEAKAALLGEALAAFGAALEVRTRADDPIGWASTQRKLGLALEEMGDLGDANATQCYRNALACFEAALSVFDDGCDHAACTTHRQSVAGKLAAATRGKGPGAAKPQVLPDYNVGRR